MLNMVIKALGARIYLIAAVAVLAYSGGLYWFAYNDGRGDCENQVMVKTIEVNKQSRGDADEVKRETQSLDDVQLDVALCGAGIVRQNNGC